jgi:hypothetical protein
MTVTFEKTLALAVAFALHVPPLTGCASRELMSPEPTALSLSGGSVPATRIEGDGGARPASETLRDRDVLGGATAAPRDGAR